MRLTCSLLLTWGGRGVRSAIQHCPMGAANRYDFLYSVQQRKDVKCLTLLVYYARPATAHHGQLCCSGVFVGTKRMLALVTAWTWTTLMPGATASVESASGSSLLL